MYLLDTNILSELIKKRPNHHFLDHLRSKPNHTLYTSSICVMELRYGSMLRKDFDIFWSKINEQIISRINVLVFGEKEAIAAGDILAEMRKTGQHIGIEDSLIAASALINQCVMVTGNIRHFSRIPGMRVENWIK